MKKNILSALCMVLSLTMVLSIVGFVTASGEVSATPTASAVLVDGEAVSFCAYNINDNNYFKLRDIAYALSGSAAQFSVNWDEAANAISLTSGEAYTSVGGEMTSGNTAPKTAKPTDAKVLLGGKEIKLTAYNIDDSNYFKLRDLGAALAFAVDFTESSNVITIATETVDGENVQTPQNTPTASGGNDTIAVMDENGEIKYIPRNNGGGSSGVQPVVEVPAEEYEIANVPSQFQFDVAEGEPGWMQISGEVLIIHAHDEQEAQFLLDMFLIPRYIYDEMEELGWKYKQQREFIMDMNTYGFEINKAWAAYKDGMTKDEMITQYAIADETRNNLIQQYLYEEITLDEYMEQYPMFLEKATPDQIRQTAIEMKERAEKSVIRNSGLTDAEIALCKENGITRVKDMAEIKALSQNKNLEFSSVVNTRKVSKNIIEVEAKLTGQSYEALKAKADAADAATR